MPIGFPATQDSKPVIKDKSGNSYIDFLQKDINITSEAASPRGMNYYIVTENTEMRIDLISKGMYGLDTDFIERILKFNGISNPLSLESGDVLVVYEPYSLIQSLRSQADIESLSDQVRKQYITPEKKSKIDPQLQAFDKRNKSPKKVESTNLPPNYADFGDQEIEIRGGKIYFGPNVSKSKVACEEPLSKSEFLARLVKNRINNR
jgi:hypothetical protein